MDASEFHSEVARTGLREVVIAYVKVGVFLNRDTASLVGGGVSGAFMTSSFEYPKTHESEPQHQMN